MGGIYPTASNYRGSGGTIRAPGPTRRDGPANSNVPGPGKPANRNRPKGTYRPPKERPDRKKPKAPGKRWKDIPRPKPKAVSVPRIPAQANPLPAPAARGFLAVLGRVSPYVAAFELGFMVGSILFNVGEQELLVSNPGGWEEYICPGYSNGQQGPLQLSATRYPQAIGIDQANCISGQFVAGAPAPGNDFGVWEDYGVFIRRRHRVSFGSAGALDPLAIPSVRWGRKLAPVVVSLPFADVISRGIWHNPALMPINAPAIFPKAPPVWGPQPGNSPFHQAGNSLQPGAGQLPSAPAGTPTPTPQNPARDPVIRIDRGNGRPPGRNVKERKLRGTARAMGLATAAMNVVSETGDFVDSFYKALDKDCLKKAGAKAPGNVWKSGHRQGAMGTDGRNWRWEPGKGWTRQKGYYVPVGLQQKAEAVYRHFGCVDAEKAFQNILANEVEDRIIGKIGSIAKKAGQKSRPHGGLPIGFQVGPVF